MNKDALLVGLFFKFKDMQLNILLLNRHDYRFEETLKDKYLKTTMCIFTWLILLSVYFITNFKGNIFMVFQRLICFVEVLS